MIIKVFISHAEKDIKLAKILKEKLETSGEIEAFMYEEEKRYGTEVVEKITKEIKESDHLIAIIAKTSASVHQEIGYAKGIGKNIISMVKEGVSKGFLVYGVTIEDFTDYNFKEKCANIVKDVIKQGSQLKESVELMEKGAHYRYEINESIINFLLNIIIFFNIKDTKIWIPEAINDKIRIYDTIKEHFLSKGMFELKKSYKIDLELWEKLLKSSKLFQEKTEKAKEYPYTKLSQRESELLGKIQHNILIQPWPENADQIDLQIFLDKEITKVYNLLEFMSQLLKLYIDYETKFKKNAFKTIYD